MRFIQIALPAVLIALVLLLISAFNMTAAILIGMMALLLATIIGLRQNPPVFRWALTVGLGGLLAGGALWSVFDNSPFVVRIHNSGSRPVVVALNLARTTYPSQTLIPGQSAWRSGQLQEGSVSLTCDDGRGPLFVDIEGYVTNGMSLVADIDIPTCATAKVSSKADIL